MVNPNLCSGRLPRRKYFFHAMITSIWIKNRNKITVKNTCSSRRVKGFDKKQYLHRLCCLNCCTFHMYKKKIESEHLSYKLKERRYIFNKYMKIILDLFVTIYTSVVWFCTQQNTTSFWIVGVGCYISISKVCLMVH